MYRRSVTACRGNPGAILLNSHSLILRKSAASFASMTSLPLASAYATRSIFSRIAVSSTLSRLVAPHALQSSLSGPAVPDFLSDFLEQAAETLGEPLFGASNGPTGALLPSHSCQTRISWRSRRLSCRKNSCK